MALVPQLRWELPRLSVAGSTPCPATLNRHYLVEKSTSEEANRKKKKKKKGGKNVCLTPKAAVREQRVRWALKTPCGGGGGGQRRAQLQPHLGELGACLNFSGQSDHKGALLLLFSYSCFFIIFFFFPCANDSLCGVGRRREKGSWGEPSRPLLPSAAGGGMLPPKGGYGTRTPAQVMLLTQKSPNIPAHNGHTVNMSFPIM